MFLRLGQSPRSSRRLFVSRLETLPLAQEFWINNKIPHGPVHVHQQCCQYGNTAGEKVLFSEQQMMDCSWGYGLNKACDGGDYDAAMDYLKLAGGPVQEKDYEYLGADGFCRDKNFSTGQRATFEVLRAIVCHQ